MERSEIRDPAYATLLAGYGTEALRQARDRPRRAGELQDVQPGVGAVDHIDEAALVGLDVVALDRGLAAVLAVDLDAARIGLLGDRRDEEAGFLRLVWIAHGERADAAAALAEMPARLLDGPVRHHHRPRLDRHVCEPHHLPRLLAFVH